MSNIHISKYNKEKTFFETTVQKIEIFYSRIKRTKSKVRPSDDFTENIRNLNISTRVSNELLEIFDKEKEEQFKHLSN